MMFQGFYKHGRKKEDQFYAEQKICESLLNNSLANPLEKKTEREISHSNYPYQVKYLTANRMKEEFKNPLLLLIENSPLYEKKYLFHESEIIMVGEQYGKIKVIPKSDFNANLNVLYCEFFYRDGYYCVRAYGNNEVLLKRKHKCTMVDEIGIRLKTGDIVRLPNDTFEIQYVKNK